MPDLVELAQLLKGGAPNDPAVMNKTARALSQTVSVRPFSPLGALPLLLFLDHPGQHSPNPAIVPILPIAPRGNTPFQPF